MDKKNLEKEIKELQEFVEKANPDDLENIRKILEIYGNFMKKLRSEKQIAVPLPLEEDEVTAYAVGGLEKLHPSL